MKKYFLICSLLLVSCLLVAQSQARIVSYFDAAWKPLIDSTGASYYRTIEDQPDGRFLAADYYISGELFMKPVICTAYLPKLVWDGQSTFYHKNGKVKQEGNFKAAKRDGLHKYWHANGINHRVIWFEDDKEIKIHQVWSEEGEAFLTKGTGIVSEPRKDGSWMYNEIVDSVRISSYLFDAAISDTVYYFLPTPAEYKGGHSAMIRKIKMNTVYPKSARKADIEGTVYVGFVVDENGRTVAHEILKGIGGECDREALRVVALLNEWNPGVHRGKNVKVKFVLPIIFKLD